ncbi:AT-hook motif nuclear-localized protein 2-like isoform X2 [Amaranthus tricolor]|uniref:AT-hook motif nuclear-localized protein 2-like isoform X2 n=1 Tax=Amaranthus tricolor TaxID=29722 RepID=UPI0025882C5B|nr:AT-hook motif nuclear-localized protein 2-like isoform X2 [Amaranthus tricolor]
MEPPNGNTPDSRGRLKRGRPKIDATPEEFSLKKSLKISSEDDTNFKTHVVNVASEEDVYQKILSLMQKTKKVVCILAAHGFTSRASLQLLTTIGKIVTYKVLVATFVIKPKKDASAGVQNHASSSLIPAAASDILMPSANSAFTKYHKQTSK